MSIDSNFRRAHRWNACWQAETLFTFTWGFDYFADRVARRKMSQSPISSPLRCSMRKERYRHWYSRFHQVSPSQIILIEHHWMRHVEKCATTNNHTRTFNLAFLFLTDLLTGIMQRCAFFLSLVLYISFTSISFFSLFSFFFLSFSLPCLSSPWRAPLPRLFLFPSDENRNKILAKAETAIVAERTFCEGRQRMLVLWIHPL